VNDKRYLNGATVRVHYRARQYLLQKSISTMESATRVLWSLNGVGESTMPRGSLIVAPSSIAVRGEFCSRIEVSQWRRSKIAKPAGGSCKSISEPRRGLLEVNGVSAVRVKRFPKHSESSSKVQGDRAIIWVIQLAKSFALNGVGSGDFAYGRRYLPRSRGERLR
jgi:hypothetical protein